MKIAVVGLGRMGMQIVRKLLEDGYEVIAYNRTHDAIDEAKGYGAIAAYDREDVIKAFAGGEKLVLWLMIPSDVVDAEIDEWLKLVPKNSIIVDGGNSNFRLTQSRAERIQAKGSLLIDVGTSGGIWGYERGFCMMAGGDEETFRIVEPALKTLSHPSGGYQYFGSSGSGHYVKMIHNAIEYGMMQSLAEGYRMLKDGPYEKLDLAAAAKVWQQSSVITSWLNELCQQILEESPELEGVDGYVAELGEARWTLETAKEMNIPLPAIQSALEVRWASQKGETSFATKVLAAMRNKFGGHSLNK